MIHLQTCITWELHLRVCTEWLSMEKDYTHRKQQVNFVIVKMYFLV